jgi:hypothetical protein
MLEWESLRAFCRRVVISGSNIPNIREYLVNNLPDDYDFHRAVEHLQSHFDINLYGTPMPAKDRESNGYKLIPVSHDELIRMHIDLKTKSRKIRELEKKAPEEAIAVYDMEMKL